MPIIVLSMLLLFVINFRIQDLEIRAFERSYIKESILPDLDRTLPWVWSPPGPRRDSEEVPGDPRSSCSLSLD